jgi:hypothetical protein
MEIGGGSRIVEKKKSRRGVENNRMWWSAKYSAIGCKVIIAFTIIFRM